MQSPGRSVSSRLTAALAHQQRGEWQAAELLYREILRAAPANFGALYLLGNLTAARGATDEALRLIQEAIRVDPAQGMAHYSASTYLLQRGDHESALASAERACLLQPDHVPSWFLHGTSLLHLNRAQDAAVSFRRAIDLQPDFAEASNNLGVALRALGRLPEARQSVERALAIRPDYTKAWNNHGLILLDERRAAGAVDSFQRALGIEPRFAEALHNLGTALMSLKRYEEAAAAYARLIALDARFPYALGNLLHARLSCCDWTDHARTRRAILEAVQRGERADLPLAFMAVCGSAALQLGCAKTYVRDRHPPRAPLCRARGARTDQRIHVGYLSADLQDHPVAQLLAGVLERHDRTRYCVNAFALSAADGSAMSRRLRAACELVHDVSGEDDEGIAQRIRAAGIDVLVDLNGHTLGNRLGVLARRPAAIQVNFLGYAGTSGADYLDYLIADETVVPSDQEAHYSESIVRLPHVFLPHDDRQPIAAPGPARRNLGLPEGGVVFCAFNNAFKLNPAMFDIWMPLLSAVPGSVLWLKSGDAVLTANLQREAAARGVDPGRLIFAPRVAALDEHLARYQAADLFLDTFPYGAHATAMDALWAGLPVLTCGGEAMAGRVAASLLRALDLPALIASDAGDYLARARQLANDPTRIALLRRLLNARMRSSPAFSTSSYCRSLEAAYTEMVTRLDRGERPRGFSVRGFPD